MEPFDDIVTPTKMEAPIDDFTSDQTPQTPGSAIDFGALSGLEVDVAEIENPDAVQEKLASLYNVEECSDIVFIVRNRRFFAIKALVCGWSPVFKSMLCGEFIESSLREVPLDDVEETSMEMFLKVIYSGKTGPYPIHNFVDLYAFANRFEVPEIEKLCLTALQEQNLAKHLFPLIDACEKYIDLEEIEKIRTEVVAKICCEFDEVCSRPDFVNMRIDYLLRFLKSGIIVIPEDVLFNSLMRWIVHDKEQRIQYLDELLSFIRFPMMESVALTEIENHPLLQDKMDEMKSIIYEAMKFQLNKDAIPEERRVHENFKEREGPPEEDGHSYKYKKVFTLTSLGCTGSVKPTSIGTHYDKHLSKVITLKNGIQEWKVHASGKYRITAVGASGGINPHTTNTKGGKGAKVSGIFKLKRGQLIQVLVGQKGEDATGSTGGGAAGGGGGTFVVDGELQQPLIIGAGGSGANWYSFTIDGPGGQLYDPSIESTKSVEAYAERGGGGGGFYIKGANGSSCTGGASFLEGGSGGTNSTSTYGAKGGFGGGGGSEHEGGGGGGYVGGKSLKSNEYNTSRPDYGAYSFNSGLKPEGEPACHVGDGYVEFARVF
ncbi:predicted protein [Naegleria gruberi]|uniref:receptor protein-tyrosine kinase n=1 Tax=Naegleria gruberi TaxID=5762 RepID=D2VNE6_NAEGR|nr:uncharacterized protein NAEGRDRAFT_80637 [Naegleria gruberi]EFC41645.1 predicted protein [Naegleria gruberi]|eukprot:XP_002674389.1 predicted protein [Naegleria gruberi strain NEG-M]